MRSEHGGRLASRRRRSRLIFRLALAVLLRQLDRGLLLYRRLLLLPLSRLPTPPLPAVQLIVRQVVQRQQPSVRLRAGEVRLLEARRRELDVGAPLEHKVPQARDAEFVGGEGGARERREKTLQLPCRLKRLCVCSRK